MKRFIDLRGMGTGSRFAWWDTIRDQFDQYCGDYAWDTWREFIESVGYDGRWHVDEVSRRYRPLAPEWVHEEVEEDE